ncbi:MAG: hypothetical protein ACOC56_02655 [Atribacterota bacterium]
MEFNKDKVKIKHILEMSKSLESWPDSDDILYFICKRYADKNKFNEITFSDYMLQTKLDISDSSIIKMKDSLIKLEESGYIKKIKEHSNKITYKLLINPYIK